MKEHSRYLKLYNFFVAIIFFFMGILLHTPYIPRKILWLGYILFFLSVIVVVIIDKNYEKKLRNLADIREILLVMFLGTYWVCRYKYYEDYRDLNESVMFCVIPIMLYILGKIYVIQNKNDSLKSIKNVVLPLGFGTMVFYIVGIFSYYCYPHKDARLYHTFLLPGSGNIAATFYSFYSLILISIISWCIASLKKEAILKIIVMILGIVSATWSFIETQTRLPIVALFLSAFGGLCIYICNNACVNGLDKIKKQIKYASLLLFVVIFVAIICIAFCEPVRTFYNENFIDRDGGLLNNCRIQWTTMALKDLPQYPLGGNHSAYPWEGVGDYITCTNTTWGDFAYYGGIIPFVGMMLWMICIFKDVVALMISNKTSVEIKMLIILPFISLVLLGWAENYQDTCYRFSIFLLFAGMIRGQVLSIKCNEK